MVVTAPIARPGILDIEAYVPGESKVPGDLPPAKLSSNETPLGPSPAAIAAFKAAAGELERYPDGQATLLRKPSPAVTASTPAASSAAQALTSFLGSSRAAISDPATRRSIRRMASSFTASRF